jgi:hypothetical protein
MNTEATIPDDLLKLLALNRVAKKRLDTLRAFPKLDKTISILTDERYNSIPAVVMERLTMLEELIRDWYLELEIRFERVEVVKPVDWYDAWVVVQITKSGKVNCYTYNDIAEAEAKAEQLRRKGNTNAR